MGVVNVNRRGRVVSSHLRSNKAGHEFNPESLVNMGRVSWGDQRSIVSAPLVSPEDLSQLSWL